MIRAVLYARYSSDLQSPASIEDQFRICRDHAEKAGWTVVDTVRIDPRSLIRSRKPSTVGVGAVVILEPASHAAP